MPGAAVGATLGEGVQASAQAERGLTNEPLYQGEPILAIAAVDEKTAAEAIEAIAPLAAEPPLSVEGMRAAISSRAGTPALLQ